MTPREFSIWMDGALWRRDLKVRSNIMLAHQTANLTRAKKLPKLASLLPKQKRDAPAQSVQEQILALRAVGANAMGNVDARGSQ